MYFIKIKFSMVSIEMTFSMILNKIYYIKNIFILKDKIYRKNLYRFFYLYKNILKI